VKIRLFLFSFILLSVLSGSAKSKGPKVIQWNIAELVTSKSEVRIAGNPQIMESKFGKVLEFNGIGDGLFLTETPLADLKQFTIEALFYPESGGKFEQRFFHTGEISGDRVLLEIRTTDIDWYFDAFVQAGNQKMTLIDPTMLHPLNQWVHVAYVVDHGKLYTYINGQKELEGSIKFSPIKTGMTSIGVRLNEQSWFKGAISQIRISPKALKPKEFLNL
jgi:hypothetical protein